MLVLHKNNYTAYILYYLSVIHVAYFIKAILPLRKNLLHVGSKCKANNYYFAIIIQVLEVGKQFATTANSAFVSYSMFIYVACFFLSHFAFEKEPARFEAHM